MSSTDQGYDPMIACAAMRSMVCLKDGRCGKLIYWAKGNAPGATIYRDGRHVPISKDDVSYVVQEPPAP